MLRPFLRMIHSTHTSWLLLVVAFCLVPAHADTISYTDSGTFSASTASSTFSGPGETWSFAFQADRNPAILEFGGGGFNFAFSNFTYSLGGSAVAIAPTFIRFFTAANGGGFLICFNGTDVPSCTDGISSAFFSLPQMYTGPNSSPTLLSGKFTGDLVVTVSSTSYDMGSSTVQASAVPEPSSLTLLTLAAGLFALVKGVVAIKSRHTLHTF